MFKSCDIIYQINYERCDSSYVGKTAREVHKRFEEHTRQPYPLTAVGEPIMDTGHNILPDHIKVLDSEETWYRCCIKEALYIKEHRADINRSQGVELPPPFTTNLCHMGL